MTNDRRPTTNLHPSSFIPHPSSLILLILAAVLTACIGRAPAAQETVAGEIVTVFVGDLAAGITASGTIVPARQAAVSASTPGRVLDIYAQVGDSVQAGDALLQLDTTALALNVATAEQNLRLKEAALANLQAAPHAADVAATEAAVRSAQASLDDLLDGPGEIEMILAETAVRAAEASLWSASAELNRAANTITDAQIQQAEGALLLAQIALEQARRVNADDPTQATHDAMLAAEEAYANAQATLDALRGGNNTSAAASSTAAAAARLESAEADFTLEASGPTEVELAAGRAQLAQAQAALGTLVAEPSQAQVRAVQAEVEQARLSLADTQEALEQATVKAPFAGVVTAVHVSEGETAAGIVAEIADTTTLEVALAVDEIDVGHLAVGQAAQITLETWPETVLDSQVLAIAPAATVGAGSAVATYEVRLSLDAAGLPVRLGMTANATLVTGQRQGVLLLPNQAIQVDREAGTYSVNVVEDGQTRAVPVTIGLRDGQYTEITSGLAEGDQIVINVATTDTPADAAPGLLSLAAGETGAETEVETAVVFTGDLAASATAAGRVEARRSAQLSLAAVGPVAEVYVAAGDRVRRGDALLKLDTADLERAVASAEQTLIIQEANLATLTAPSSPADLLSAQAAVASAQARLNDLLDGPGAEELASAEADARAAAAEVGAAAARLNNLLAAAGEAELQAAEIALGQAQAAATRAAEQHRTILVTEPNFFLSEEALASLELAARAAAVTANANLLAAEEALAQLQNGDGNTIASARAGVALAQVQLEAAQARLDLLRQGPSAVQVASAEATLAQVQAALDRLQRGPSALQLTTAEVAVENAHIALERARQNLEEATLRAPFDGLVAAVNVSVGEQASGAPVTMVDDASLEVVLNVDEVDMAAIALGQPAEITLEARPEETIAGTVTAVAPRGGSSLESTLVTFNVYLSLGETAGPVYVGMTANASLETARREGVLLLPNAAIQADRSNGTYSVTLVETAADGERTFRTMPVTIGLRDGQYTQITSGLEEGDEVTPGVITSEPVLGPGGQGGPGGGDGPGFFGRGGG